MIEQGLMTLLAGNAPIAALVGTRISWVVLPENSTLPALTFQNVGSISSPTFETRGMQRMRVQFDCWGATYLDAITLRKAVETLLDGFQGTLSDGTYLQNVVSLQQVDFFDHDVRVFRAMIEFRLYYD
jgi:hypothetical protein